MEIVLLYIHNEMIQRRKHMNKLGDMHWAVMYYNCNARRLETYNILWYREEFIKNLKKKVTSKEEFIQKMKSEMMHHHWSKSEWEVILTNKDSRIIMSPLIGREDIEVDVTDRKDFDWVDFFNKQAEHYRNKTQIKIDVWDQIYYKWDEFIDYCWSFHHKWQRRKKNEI